MDQSALIAKMAEQRSRWVSLKDGKRVRFRRPLETEFGKFRAGVTVDHLCEYVFDWEGFTEADLLGPAIGASDAVAFDPELWSTVVRDRIDYVQPIAEGIVAAITEHLEARETAGKNSQPS